MIMKLFKTFLVLALGLIVPLVGFAATPVARQKTLTGTVIRSSENQVVFRVSSAATYTAQTWGSKLIKKFGADMSFGEILVGDKVEVKGMVWPDNSINATQVRNLTLYAHSETFSGKVNTLDPFSKTFTLQTASSGLLTVTSDGFTVYTKNGSPSGLTELEPGISVSVKGLWERDKTKIHAKEVKATLRLVNIDITGQIMMLSPTSITVLANANVIYGVDTKTAKLLDKKGKAASYSQFSGGDTVRVKGKHISGKNQITASEVRNNSLPR